MMTSPNGNIFRVTGHLSGNSPVPGEFPAQRPVTRSFDVFFDLRLNKRLSKQSWGWWFDTLSRPLWRHRNVASQSKGLLFLKWRPGHLPRVPFHYQPSGPDLILTGNWTSNGKCRKNLHAMISSWRWGMWLIHHTRGPFHRRYSIVIFILCKFGFRVTPLQATISVQSLAHNTTAQLLCHLENIVAIVSQKTSMREKNEISNNFELWWKKSSVKLVLEHLPAF